MQALFDMSSGETLSYLFRRRQDLETTAENLRSVAAVLPADVSGLWNSESQVVFARTLNEIREQVHAASRQVTAAQHAVESGIASAGMGGGSSG